MAGIYLAPLPLELDVSCPIVPWRSSKPTTDTDAIILPPDEDEAQHLREYVQRRYWETLYLPEVRLSSRLLMYADGLVVLRSF